MGQIIKLPGFAGLTANQGLASLGAIGAYAAGQLITDAGPSLLRFDLPSYVADQGYIVGLTLVDAPASGNFVPTAADIMAWLFRKGEELAAVADRTAYALTAATAGKSIARFSFANASWLGPTGTVTAGAIGYQRAAPAVISTGLERFSFRDKINSGDNATVRSFYLALQAVGAWSPGNIVQNWTAYLDVELQRD